MDRQFIIDYYKEKGRTQPEINDRLKALGQKELTFSERKAIGGPSLGASAKRNLQEIAASFPTMAGLLARGIADATTVGREEPWATQTPSYQEALKRQTQAGEYIVPMFTDVRNIVNIPLGQYGITTERIGGTVKKALGQGKDTDKTLSWGDIGYNIKDNPVYFGWDLLTLGKPVGKALSTTKPAKRVSELKEFNRILNTVRTANLPTAEDTDKIAKLSRSYDALPFNERVAVSEALQKTGATNLGSKNANKVLKNFKSVSQTSAEALQKANLLDATKHEQNILATYIGNNMGWSTPKGKPLNHAKIIEKILNPEKLTGEYKKFYDSGLKHIKEGNLAFVTQSLNPANVNLLGTPSKSAGSWFTSDRVIGTRTPAEMVDVLPAALKRQADFARKMQEVKDLVNVLKNYQSSGKAKTYLDIANMDTYLSNAVLKGKSAREIIDNLPTVASPTSQQIASGAVKPLSNMEMNALRRFGTYSAPSDFTNIFKRSVLGGPKWFAENRVGNLINNLIEGTGPIELKQALFDVPVPSQLDKLTRAYGYAGNRPKNVLSSLGDALVRSKEGGSALANAFKEKNLNLGIRGVGNIFGGIADAFSNPMFSLEASFDKLERLTNLTKQVQREAKRTGKTETQIWNQINKDPQEFAKIYEKVNKSLGDYTTRNYFIPTALEQVRSDVFPFYKFITNTLGTTTRQAMNHPFRTQAGLIIPSKAGRDIRQDLIDKGVLLDTGYTGGYPTGKETEKGDVQTLRSDSVPIGSVSRMLSPLGGIGVEGPKELTSSLSPVFSIADTLHLKDRFGNPLTSPRWEVQNEVPYSLDEQGEATLDAYVMSPLEYLGIISKQFGKQLYSPLARSQDIRRIAQGFVRPLLTGEQGVMYPMYGVEASPWAKGDTTRQPARGALEILGPLAGIRVQGDVDYTKKPTRRGLKQLRKKRAKRRGGNY